MKVMLAVSVLAIRTGLSILSHPCEQRDSLAFLQDTVPAVILNTLHMHDTYIYLGKAMSILASDKALQRIRDLQAMHKETRGT